MESRGMVISGIPYVKKEGGRAQAKKKAAEAAFSSTVEAVIRR
jgi:hypothetical protein